MRSTLLAQHIGAELRGPDLEITGVASFQNASPTDLLFIQDPKYTDAVKASKGGAVIAPPALADAVSGKTVLVTVEPRLAFARAAELLRRSIPPAASIHPSAVIDPSARLGRNVTVAALAYVGPNVVVGDDSTIGPGCVLLSDVVLGSHCHLVARITAYPNTTIGDRAVIHAGTVLGGDGFGFVRDPKTGAYEKFPQIGTLVIGNDVEIGCNTAIDRGALGATTIGNGVKLDNLIHIAHNATVGENAVIAGQSGVSGSATVERDCVIAGQVGVADHVRVCEGVILGAQCGVPTNKILRGKGMLFWGTPARPIADVLKELAAVSRLVRKKKSGE